MTDLPSQSAIADDPTQAFEGLRQEISLLHTAIQGLTAAREKMPDYNLTLGAIGKQLANMTESIEAVAQAPAVKLTPTVMVRELAKAAIDVRADDKRQMDEARAVLHQSIGQLDGIALRARTKQHQRKREMGICSAAFFAGILLWSFLPGAIARSLPASWHVPEWMAARTLGIKEGVLSRCMVARTVRQDTASETAGLSRHEVALREDRCLWTSSA